MSYLLACLVNNTCAKKLFFFSQLSINKAHDTAKYNGQNRHNGDNVNGGGGGHGYSNDNNDADER